MRRILTISACLLAFAAQAFAEPLPKAPGWHLTLIEQNQDENSYGGGAQYFALKPPDNRPAITVDYSVAQKLRSGELKAEVAYSGKDAPPAEAVAAAAPALPSEEDLVAATNAAANGAFSGGPGGDFNMPGMDSGAIAGANGGVGGRKPAAAAVEDNSPPAGFGVDEAQRAAWSSFMNWRASGMPGQISGGEQH